MDLSAITVGAVGSWIARNWKKILRAVGLVPIEQAHQKPKSQTDIQIELDREIGGTITKYSVRLRDLLVSPYGIVAMLDDYRISRLRTMANPTDSKWVAVKQQKWAAIKQRARDNHDRLENLYGAMNTLEQIRYFAYYDSPLNDIDRVIQTKEHEFYHFLDRHPIEEPPEDDAEIEDLCQRARKMQDLNGEVVAIQKKVGTYLDDNWDHLQKVLRLPRTDMTERVKPIEVQPEALPKPVKIEAPPETQPGTKKGGKRRAATKSGAS